MEGGAGGGQGKSGGVPGGGKHPPGFTKDMLKPLIFGNHQSHFKMFNAIICVALGYYMVFEHDFGPKRHIFSWIRDFKAKTLFGIDPEDQEVQAIKQEMMDRKRTAQPPSTGTHSNR